MTLSPDNRVNGTTYEEGVHPEGAVPLLRRRDRLREALVRLVLGGTVRLMRPREGDVLVVSSWETNPEERARLSQRLNAALHRGGERDPVAIVLPGRAMVHLEGRRLQTEDRGYRETSTYGTDRGVHVGVPDEVK